MDLGAVLYDRSMAAVSAPSQLQRAQYCTGYDHI